MRLIMSCFQCQVENPIPEITWVEFQDSHLYEFTCSKGHKSSCLLLQQKFEILFAIGSHAILDGYYREAVASFTSSLERFYEYFIKVKLLDEKNQPSMINKTWKEISSQSERQLGAFIVLYAQTFKNEPKLLAQSKVTFRNAVVHKGKIPSKSEALDYGQAVLDVINPIADQMMSKFEHGMMEAALLHAMEHRKPMPDSPPQPLQSATSPSVLNVTSRPKIYEYQTLSDGLKHLEVMQSFYKYHS
ncbi:hypothetical protein IFT96_03555 [Pseudomonas fluorescens]|nr:hypothetical protein [uncultured Pseudomonas sp.]MBD8254434.1 hypothetical protein [Pseudomonas fluorescens]